MNIKTTLFSKFKNLHDTLAVGEGQVEWIKFISKQVELGQKNLTLEINADIFSQHIECSKWDFSNVDLVFEGDFKYNINFSFCHIKSLTIKNNDSPHSRFFGTCNFYKSTFHDNVNINVEFNSSRTPKFEHIKFLSSKNVLKIKINNTFIFQEVDFGNDKTNNQDLEIDIFSSSGATLQFKDVKFYTKDFLLNCSGVHTRIEFIKSFFVESSNLIFNGNNSHYLTFDKQIFNSQKTITFRKFEKVHGILILANCKSIEIDQISELRVKKIKHCIIASSSTHVMNITTYFVLDSTFESKTNIHSNPDPDNNCKFVVIKNSTFKNELTTHSSHSTLPVFRINKCAIPFLYPHGSIEVIRSTKMGNINAYHCNHLIIRKSRISFLEISNNCDYLKIQDTTIANAHLKQCEFKTCAIFSSVTFVKAPHISNLKFSSCNVDFYDPKFGDKESAEALGAFRAFLKACSDAGYEHGVISFHALELETYYNKNLKTKKPLSSEWPEKISSEIHKLLTDYGTNLIKPFYVLCLIFILGFDLHHIFNLQTIGKECANNAFILSLSNTLGPLSFALDSSYRTLCANNNAFVQVSSFIQIISCSTIWFLIVFMIRRRFKI
ncbi:MAG: hypothetical protein HON23_02365 [Rickettsiales bacterium]|jgi:hypothetical protein|nr:hypothetical protein [Rickettsiales bacterium]